MEQQNVKPEDLVGVVGSEDIVFDLVNGGSEIGNELAEVLGDVFIEPLKGSMNLSVGGEGEEGEEGGDRSPYSTLLHQTSD